MMESKSKIDVEGLVERKLKKYMFPISEQKIYFGNVQRGSLKNTNEYKGIFREDKKKLISVMKNSYQVISNREVILPLMEELSKLDTRWIIDDSHSFVDSYRMRLQITFPELKFNDGQSEIAISIYLSNSLDGRGSVKILFGAIRFSCLNGMLLGTIFSRFYHKHTRGIGIEIKNIGQQIHDCYNLIPAIKNRINTLKRFEVTENIKAVIEEKLGKNISRYVDDQKPSDNWALYNACTNYISHKIHQRNRAQYQMAVSRLFRL